MWFALNLFFYTEERPHPQLVWSASKDTKVFSMVAPGQCYESENKRKCTEPESERMSSDLMELNDTELKYINFGDETDSGNTIWMKTFCFSIRDILHYKTHFVFLNVRFLWGFFDWNVFYICVILILLKMSTFLEMRFDRNFNICKVPSFKDFQNVVFVSKSFFW